MVHFKRLSLYALLLFVFGAVSAQADSFWVPRSEPVTKEKAWSSFVPSEKALSKQAVLLHTVLPSEEPVMVRHVLSYMHSGVKELKVLGRKDTTWRDSTATIVSFSGLVDDKRVLGRVVLAPTDEGTEVLLLVRHPEANPRILANFKRIVTDWPEFLTEKQD